MTPAYSDAGTPRACPIDLNGASAVSPGGGSVLPDLPTKGERARSRCRPGPARRPAPLVSALCRGTPEAAHDSEGAHPHLAKQHAAPTTPPSPRNPLSRRQRRQLGALEGEKPQGRDPLGRSPPHTRRPVRLCPPARPQRAGGAGSPVPWSYQRPPRTPGAA